LLPAASLVLIASSATSRAGDTQIATSRAADR
jgi:hypothetical protein